MNADHLQPSSVQPEFVSLPQPPTDETSRVAERTCELLDETISEEGFAELERELACSSKARTIYLEIVQMHIELQEVMKLTNPNSSLKSRS